jgi:hypothetical protein
LYGLQTLPRWDAQWRAKRNISAERAPSERRAAGQEAASERARTYDKLELDREGKAKHSKHALERVLRVADPVRQRQVLKEEVSARRGVALQLRLSRLTR